MSLRSPTSGYRKARDGGLHRLSISNCTLTPVFEAGNATFNAREGTHDDLVLALALSVFGLSRPEPVDAVRVQWAR